MKFLDEAPGRTKAAKRSFLLVAVGCPTAKATLPDVGQRPLSEVVTHVRAVTRT